jgi:glycosyltransferase involved in cell wall biosynthesis
VLVNSWPVMVLAHNEERHIVACLDSIFASEGARAFEVFVMANGCTDRTEQLVRDYARREPSVQLVSIELGDKCNAWNEFIHKVAPTECPSRSIYYFMDGDARVVRGSLTALARTLDSKPRAHAAAAVPGSGRNAARDAQELIRDHGLVANLYALRGKFVERLRQAKVRLPLKLEGDDGLLGALIKWDLAPERQGFELDRIAPCPEASFEFEPLSPFRPANWRMYWRRAVRYGRRNYEFQLLGRALKTRGLAGLPADVTDLYDAARSLPLRWQGLYTVTNFIALEKMRKLARSRVSSRSVT